MPVLLDFGLTKRFTPAQTLAFARLVHASEASDIDGLLQSFDEMGLKLNRYDPFEDMAAMRYPNLNPNPNPSPSPSPRQVALPRCAPV